MKIKWQLFPRNLRCPSHLKNAVDVFENALPIIGSDSHEFESNKVLALVSPELESLGYCVEKSKSKEDKITVPVLFGENGVVEKFFDADAYSEINRTVIEVEAGRAFSNYQFLKDLFEACVMVDVDYCIIAVRQKYKKSNDFDKITKVLETLYASNRLSLPLKGVLIIGY